MALFSNWPYPPIYFLILAPLAALPYVAAFLTWGVADTGSDTSRSSI